MRLRVLLPNTINDPRSLVDRVLTARALNATTEIVPPSLEDVFVAATLTNNFVEQAA